MAITVTERPSKTLSNGFLSKWSSSELPLQYKFTSDRYPVNKVDTALNITSLVYNVGYVGVLITFLEDSPFTRYSEVTINGTGTALDGGIFSIKSLTTSTKQIVLDFYTEETSSTGTAVKNYPNYKGLVKVFSGLLDQHPLESSKPIREIGVIEVDFKEVGVDNIGVANVNEYIKADINANFNDENNLDAWTSYYIETAESYDVSNGDDITNFTSLFVQDLQQNCTPFTDFTDPSFNNGLTDWNQDCVSSGCATWTDQTAGQVRFSFGTSTNLNQDITVYPNIEYNLSIHYQAVNTGTSNRIVMQSYGFDGVVWRVLGSRIDITDVNEHTKPINFTPDREYTKVGVTVFGVNSSIVIDVFDMNISTSSGQPCLYSQFATFGTKQFQDSLGGNFGDYVLAPVDSITPKMLTHFEEKTMFDNIDSYFSVIIPQSTVGLSLQNRVDFWVEIFDRNGNYIRNAQIYTGQQGDGVYTTELDLKGISPDWVTGEVYYSIVPGNTFSDADFGTFEDQTATGITMLPNSGGANQIGGGISVAGFGYESLYSGRPTFSAPNGMTSTNKNYKIFTNDSVMNVTEGLTYEIESYISMIDSAFDPRHLDNGYLYWLPNGYDFSECSVTSFDIVSWNLYDGNPANRIWVKVSTSFVAKTTEALNITLYESIFNDIPNNTGGDFNIDTITFKGPIEYISERKKIKRSFECEKYGGSLRWLNDLNGWESWFFSRPKTVKENVSNKINILRDIETDWDNNFINGETQNDTIKTTATKSITLNSQLLTRDEYKNLQVIKRSARVQYLTDEGKWQTVTIKRSGYELEEEDKDIFEMSITIDLPNTQIQAQ
jgi:hypothetical protein